MASYNFTAFTGSDVDGGVLSVGSYWTVPGSATVDVIVEDDDSNLSQSFERDTSGQQAQIEDVHGNEVGNGGQLTIDKYSYLIGEDGSRYIMFEMVQAGSDEKFYTFFSNGRWEAPPAGEKLWVKSKADYKRGWAEYEYLTAGDIGQADAVEVTTPTALPPVVSADPDPIEPSAQFAIEAEDMSFEGFQSASSSSASGGKIAKLLDSGASGTLSTTYSGDSGSFNLVLHAQDESDGETDIDVLINGALVKTVSLSNKNDGSGSDDGSYSALDLGDIELSNGDELTLVVDGDGGEWGRIDKLAFTRNGDATPTPVDPPVVEPSPPVSPPADPAPSTDTLSVTIEAEDMQFNGFQASDTESASGGKIAKLLDDGSSGTLLTTYSGDAGIFDLAIHAQDENDGETEINVMVNGTFARSVVLSTSSDETGADDGIYSSFQMGEIEVQAGDTLALFVNGDGGEWGRIDKLVLTEQNALQARGERLLDDDAEFFAKVASNITALDEFGANGDGDLIGTDGSDNLSDTSGNATIFSMGGDDIIKGLSGDDKIFGGKGDDHIEGGSGQDVLDGGQGYDVLRGGSNIDVFVFRKGDGTTVIEDFELDYDILDVEGFSNLTYEVLTSNGVQIGADVYYMIEDDLLILRNVELATMVESDLCMR